MHSPTGAFAMQQVRSGAHLRQIGNVWYYRRVVPPDVRDVFGVSEVKFSLKTSNRREAESLEKTHDVAFEARLGRGRKIAPDGLPRDPNERMAELVGRVYQNLPYNPTQDHLEKALNLIPIQHRLDVLMRMEEYQEAGEVVWTQMEQFWGMELRDLIPWSSDPAEWQRIRAEVVALIRTQRDATYTQHTLDWALDQWKKAGSRPPQTEKDGSDYIADFKACTHVRALAGVRRSHLLKWRDDLQARGT